MPDIKALTVSEVNEYMQSLIDGKPGITNIYVNGEISNYKVYPPGHHYFTLKDDKTTLKCVMFRGKAYSGLKFRPANGMKVTAFGSVNVFPRDGAYQLYVSIMLPDGLGNLDIALQQLKARLEAEGLFDMRYKKPIPKYPMKIGVITSGSGAAVHDIIRVLRKRWPIAKILLLPVRVQGAEAPPEIVGAIRYANKYNVAEVLIVGRGGGSVEDLWAFNDENVARAIFESRIPVISAVGHDPDKPVSDYVADVRAATPSNGAEICAPDCYEISDILGSMGIRMTKAMERKIDALRHNLKVAREKRVLQDPKNYVEDRRIRLEGFEARLNGATMTVIHKGRTTFAANAGKLDALSPLKVLSRGYAIVRDNTGRVVRSSQDVKSGDDVKIRFKSDEIECVVK